MHELKNNGNVSSGSALARLTQLGVYFNGQGEYL